MKKKAMALVLALGLVTVGIVSGTVAWLTASVNPVVNVFTDSDINITLAENTSNYKMIPGHTIAKDPKVTVAAESEDCWLFVKITESTTPDLDAYIAYAIADQYDATTNPNGWRIVQPENDKGEIVIGRKVLKGAGAEGFNILGAGECGVSDTERYAWGANEVLTKPEVTKSMMDAIDDETEAKPTLTFQAAAVQLYETQGEEFDVATAYAKVAWSTGNS